MTTVLPERPIVAVSPPTLAPLAHPTACPQWCKDRSNPAVHHFGPSSTAHWSPQYALANPRPLYGQPVMIRAELSRMDEGDETDRTVLFVQGETDIDLTADEADIFIAQAQAWVDTLRVLRQQMEESCT